MLHRQTIKKDWMPDEEDCRQAILLQERERIDPITNDNLFRGALYCILTTREIYANLIRVFNELIVRGLDTPERIMQSNSELSEIIKRAGYSQKKEKFVKGIAEWWQKSELPAQVLDDIVQGKQREMELRDKIADSKQAPGLGFKCTSLLFRMIGYSNTVPVDTWVIQFLHAHDYDVHEDYLTRYRGTSKKDYLKYEGWFTEIARALGKEPGKFQLEIWCKKSSWKRKSIRLTQQIFPFTRLFVPLKEEFFLDFKYAGKTYELRKYSHNYNEQTVYRGRYAELRNGWSKQKEKLWGRIGRVITGSIDEILSKVYFKDIEPRAKSLQDIKKKAKENERYIAFEITF